MKGCPGCPPRVLPSLPEPWTPHRGLPIAFPSFPKVPSSYPRAGVSTTPFLSWAGGGPLGPTVVFHWEERVPASQPGHRQEGESRLPSSSLSRRDLRHFLKMPCEAMLLKTRAPGALRISKELKTLGSPTPFFRLPQIPHVPLSYLSPHP